MSFVFVVDQHKQPRDPVHPAVARRLLKEGKAALFRRYPFTLILKPEVSMPAPTPLRLKLDPGSKTTGMVLVDDQSGWVVWAAELAHRGQQIRDALLTRRGVRRNRRQRHTRYRPARFLNRRRRTGWLPPSLESRISNVETWVRRLSRLAPVEALSMELVRFDTQLLQDAEISGVRYQQGERAPCHAVGNACAQATGPSAPRHWRGESGRRRTRRKNTSEARRTMRIRTAPEYDPRPLTWV